MLTYVGKLNICKNLNDKGFALTLDILGEHTKTKEESSSIASQYEKLLTTIHKKKLDINLLKKQAKIVLGN